MKEEYVDFSYTYNACYDGFGEENCDDNKKETVTMNGTILIDYSNNDDYSEGTYSFVEDIVMKYSDGETVTSKSKYKDVYNTDSYTILEGEGVYKGDDYEYTYQVLKPVVTKFTCGEKYFMPVSGIERDTYKDKMMMGKMNRLSMR